MASVAQHNKLCHVPATKQFQRPTNHTARLITRAQLLIPISVLVSYSSAAIKYSEQNNLRGKELTIQGKNPSRQGNEDGRNLKHQVTLSIVRKQRMNRH